MYAARINVAGQFSSSGNKNSKSLSNDGSSSTNNTDRFESACARSPRSMKNHLQSRAHSRHTHCIYVVVAHTLRWHKLCVGKNEFEPQQQQRRRWRRRRRWKAAMSSATSFDITRTYTLTLLGAVFAALCVLYFIREMKVRSSKNGADCEVSKNVVFAMLIQNICINVYRWLMATKACWKRNDEEPSARRTATTQSVDWFSFKLIHCECARERARTCVRANYSHFNNEKSARRHIKI